MGAESTRPNMPPPPSFHAVAPGCWAKALPRPTAAVAGAATGGACTTQGPVRWWLRFSPGRPSSSSSSSSSSRRRRSSSRHQRRRGRSSRRSSSRRRSRRGRKSSSRHQCRRGRSSRRSSSRHRRRRSRRSSSRRRSRRGRSSRSSSPSASAWPAHGRRGQQRQGRRQQLPCRRSCPGWGTSRQWWPRRVGPAWCCGPRAPG